MNENAKKTAVLGMLGALTLALSAAENMFMIYLPFFPVGVKPGFSNLAITLGAVSAGPAGAYALAALKIVFALAARGASAAVMCAAGTLLSVTSTVLMLALLKTRVTYAGVGMTGACLHIFGQTAAAAALTGTLSLLNTLKLSLPFALVTGAVTGLLMNLTFPAIMKTRPFGIFARR